MQVFDNGIFFTVTVLRREVEDFASTWPCSGLSRRPVTFQFDKRNGDLVDSNDAMRHPHADGGAIVALCEDAKVEGLARLGLLKQ